MYCIRSDTGIFVLLSLCLVQKEDDRQFLRNGGVCMQVGANRITALYDLFRKVKSTVRQTCRK